MLKSISTKVTCMYFVSTTRITNSIKCLHLGTVPLKKSLTDDTMSVEENNVILQDVGDKGLIILNRPKALNALNLSMINKIYPVLKQWESSKSLVIIKGAGEKAFCAGGDIKSLVVPLRDDKDGHKFGQEFFRREYTLNHLIGTFKKPYIALLNGITMGGGVGLSIHGKYRIATDNTLFAMPETGIGLFPDIGGSYFLPRLKGKLGFYLGLTGHRLKGIDVYLAGLATHFVPKSQLDELTETLLSPKNVNVEEILNNYQAKNLNQEFSLESHMKEINRCFSAKTIEEIIEKLHAENSQWANSVIEILQKVSPTSLKVTKKALDNGANFDLSESLKMEYRLACACLSKEGDFYEGVRALLVDKDQKPMWNPKSINEVTDEYVNQRFAPLSDNLELTLSKL
ncbi:3-hydroxyisobutyryl-CoA hydrolase, mitochondrial isoform X2 [Leptopilina boulardi]|uniref:3-hydroxyisobutyryl-CoA hydrolase, mitochondrial isoform X2 n=1 Tax=Leptopilina boulardi TaxID=63433 RepID=UPI0021F5AC2A|nr:3-hydroxyisobutyryl-CoA hydrolase, mitochondrial isoform X2 [Leptopilina boulardi]